MDEIKVKYNTLIYDKNKCIGCSKCVKRCEKIGICHLGIEGIGKNATILFNQENPCTLCGQCTLVCPVKAMIEVEEYKVIQELLNNKNGKVIIVQCAPSVRSSINEGFKLEHSSNIEKKLNGALKKIGFDKVFDVNFGADITTFVEANELIERLEKNENLPMFTSCCPSWVNYVEKHRPFLKKNLTSAFSPHIHSGIAYKTWWAEQNNINPKDIIVVSIMPCVSKKYEASLDKTKFNNLKAVDYVLTVRELVKMFKENNINLDEQEDFDGDELAEYTGAGVIYGSSGGVMESALRTAYKILTKKELESIDLVQVRCSFEGMKEAEIKINERVIKVAVLSSPVNFEKFIDSGEYKKYQYIEVMNCLGGCINGGGQPLLPVKPGLEEELINKRKSVLYYIDKNKSKRNALDNKILQKYLNWSDDKQYKYNLFHVNN